jgi:hypothetical protein
MELSMNRSALAGIAIFVVLSTAVATTDDSQGAYVVAAKFALHRPINGVDGTLQLLLDKRLTEPVQNELWGKGEWSFVFPAGSPLNKEFSLVPPRASKLTARDNEGRLIVERNLGAPLAKLQPWNSASGKVFLLTIDHSAGVGSYSGPGTTLIQASDGSLREVTALNMESHQEEPIRLVKSLKSDWRSEGETEILSVSCRSTDLGTFVVDYIRYSVEGSHWVEHRKESTGFWESDQPFPERSAFP